MTKKTKAQVLSETKALETKIAKLRESRAPTLAFLIESELEKAEIVLATKSVVEKVGKMAEDLATMEGEDIVPMLDALKLAYGPEIADNFHKITSEKLRAAVEAMIATKGALASEVAKLEGDFNGGAVTDMASDAGMEEVPADDLAVDPTMADDMAAGDDVDLGADVDTAGEGDLDDMFANTGEDTPAAGRVRKESAAPKGKNLDRKIVESFRKAVTEGMSAVSAAKGVAKRYAVDFSDVLDVLREAASPADQQKAAKAASDIANKLKMKPQTAADVDAAVEKMAPTMGARKDQNTAVGDLVKAQLAGANKLKEGKKTTKVGVRRKA